MTELNVKGEEIIAAQEFIEKVYTDTSRLVKVLEDFMTAKKRGYEAAFGNSALWGGSGAWSKPDEWLPKFVFRIYGRGEGKKRRGHSFLPPGLFPFVAVYFKPERIPKRKKQPVVAYGTLSLKKAVKKEDLNTCLCNDSPRFVVKESVGKWQTTRAEGVTGGQIRFQIRPLIEVNCEEEVEKIARLITARIKNPTVKQPASDGEAAVESPMN
jgi:hypothetical protein